MTGQEIRIKFLEFFRVRGHTIIPSSSLIPDDPSVLLTTAGMQQFKKYFTGELDASKDFILPNGQPARGVVSIQKCFRTSDIDEIGDERHLTFFEMLGNFSFGGYWKEEAIKYGYDFIVKEMGLQIDYVTVFEGEKNVPADEESEKIWKSLDPNIVVKRFGRSDNFWGPTGSEGPCGPTTEIYVDGIEVWNIVFNEFYQKPDGSLTPLAIKGIDTGMGLERLAKVVQKMPTVFETDLFTNSFGVYYNRFGNDVRKQRVFLDHMRSLVFLIADGVRPSNKEAGYILRRLIRRVLLQLKKSGFTGAGVQEIIENILLFYRDQYFSEAIPQDIFKVFSEEKEKFDRTLDLGLREFEKRYPGVKNLNRESNTSNVHRILEINGKDAFDLHQSYGFTIDILKDLAREGMYSVDENGFTLEFKKHQEISRAGNEGKFGGHGLYLKTGEVTVKDKSELEKVTRLHTATHLMHAGLRAVLGPEVQQNGSDITVERTRFDFNFPRKVTSEELQRVAAWVNDAIGKNLTVEWKETTYDEAIKEGALGFFKQKYPARVKVYTMYDAKTGEVFSKEFCGGPHVEHTGNVRVFKILKEESSSAGVRRIRGVVEP